MPINMPQQFLVPYDLYQIQYIRITCIQFVFYLWGTYGVFGLSLWGICRFVQLWLYFPFIRCMNM